MRTRNKEKQRAYSARWRAANIEQARESEKNRSMNRHKRNKAAINEKRREYYANNLEKFRAKAKVRNAIKYGRLVRPSKCEAKLACCMGDGKIEAHHSDYARPLDVIWVCKSCHYRLDADRRSNES